MNNDFRVIFTDKANSVFNDIVKKFSLEESPEDFAKKIKSGKLSKIVALDHLTKNFLLGTISEKNLISSLQQDLGVPIQTAEQISKEVINNLVPLLLKFPEEKFNNPINREEIIKKIFSDFNDDDQKKRGIEEKNEKFNTISKIKPPIEIEKILKKEKAIFPYEKPIENKKTATPKETKEPMIKSKKQNIPKEKDTYREPIE